MKIAQSQVELGYRHHYSERVSVKESLVTRPVTSSDNANNFIEENSTRNETLRNDVDLSERGQLLASEFSAQNSTSSDASSIYLDDQTNNSDEGLDAKTAQLKMLVEQLAGHEITLSKTSHYASPQSGVGKSGAGSNSDNSNNVQTQSLQTTRADLIYQYQESYLEQEAGKFSAQGQFITDTGETITIAMSHYSERQFYIENRVEMKVGEVEVTDPLVLNLGNQNHFGLNLTQDKVDFDIDSDGKTDNIHFATGTSGFLAIDNNKNGKIDDGSELFGALTGDGFSELAKFDKDGNQFIDEGDDVFSNLMFYQKDPQGNDIIIPISELGVGALYLGNTATPFDVKDRDNQLQASVRASSFFLFEDGRSGTLQQIDLAV